MDVSCSLLSKEEKCSFVIYTYTSVQYNNLVIYTNWFDIWGQNMEPSYGTPGSEKVKVLAQGPNSEFEVVSR